MDCWGRSLIESKIAYSSNNSNMGQTNNKMNIPEWYAGKHIFITGATGFMGKILIEKLLRSCPDIAGIHMLVRPKKNKSPRERLDDFLKQPIFDVLKTSPNASEQFKKLHCVCGDVSHENMAFTVEDLTNLRDKINIVFHMAANVRFDQPLKEALLLNTGGTLRVLEFSKTMPNLKAFIHVSTTYCHCNETVLEEKIYPAPEDPMKMLDLIGWLREDAIEALTPTLLQNSPNTYAYTKCLTEQLVTSYMDKMPIVIARPSIVVATYKEPLPGWVDNLNGPTGIMVGAGKGVIRSMHCNDQLNADIIPVDVAINSLIIIAKILGSMETKPEQMVVNLANGNDNAISWANALEIARKHVFDNPFSIMLWYPGGSAKKNYTYHAICVFFFHTLPAYFVDFLLPFFGHKKFLVHTQKKVSVGLKVLQYYTTKPWCFKNDRLKQIVATLDDQDRNTFYTNMAEISWDTYLLNYVKGARKYCLKEDPDTVPKAKRTLKKLFVAHIFVQFVFYILLFAFFKQILLMMGVLEM